MKALKILVAIGFAAALGACSSSSSGGGGGPTPFQKPAGTVAVNFTVDDTGTHAFSSEDLEWKGGWVYDATTRKGVFDASWTGPYPKLYDDGAWDQGGHEPLGATAGDHKLGVAMFVTPPTTGTKTYEYGLNDAKACDTTKAGFWACNGWIWVGGNGTFTLNAGQTTDLNATGMTIPAAGTTDVKLVIDTNNLAGGPWSTANVVVKGSAWGWNEIKLVDDGTKGDAAAGDGKYTFQLSQYIGAGNVLPHVVLPGDDKDVEFVYEFDADATKSDEYKVSSVAQSQGVTAETKRGAGAWAAAAIGVAANNNTFLHIPAAPFARPAGTVAVNFTVDDTGTQLFSGGDLEWKGGWVYDAATRKAVFDASWTGPYPKLYDDGPWDQGGHEPLGATAGDHKLGTAIFVAPPTTGTKTYEYGLNDATACDATKPGYWACNGWIWVGSNGTFTLNAGQTTDVNATGMTIPAAGTTDLRLVIDTNNVAGSGWNFANVVVKGSAWGWNEIKLVDDGTMGDAVAADGKYTFQLSEFIGAGKVLPHAALPASGSRVEFVYEFDADATQSNEYKVSSVAQSQGVTAETLPAAGSWTAATIDVWTNNNTYILIP